MDTQDYTGMHQDDKGSFEVFTPQDYPDQGHGDHSLYDGEGFYWWSCFPGCLPDGDPVGPFDTAKDAYTHAKGIY